jgi:splicing factor 3B subunit 2
MSRLDENTLQQFSDIFKHFQTGKPEDNEEVNNTLD